MCGLRETRETRRDTMRIGRKFLQIIRALTVGGMVWLAAVANGQSPAPPLSIERTGTDSFQLLWPQTSPGFILQSSPMPDRSSLWRGILQNPVLQGGLLSVPQTLSSYPDGQGFFRLTSKGVPAGLDFLLASQGLDGLWGNLGGTTFRDTTAALEALSLFGRLEDAFVSARGLSPLALPAARNNDDLSRQTIALASAGQDIAGLLTALLDSQNAVVSDPASLAYPGRGWGLATGYGNSTIDTALVLRALKAGNRICGLSVVKESLAGSATSPPHSFDVPAGASNLVMLIRQRTVSIRLRLTYPNSSSSFVDIGAGTTPTTVSFPIGTGTFSLTAQNLTASAGTYSAEIGFTGSDGFDYFRTTTPLSFLAAAQNTDGGWGIAPGEDSHLMITAEVVRALAACGSALVAPSAFSAATAWLSARQNANGGFSSEPNTSNPYETSLAMIALRLASPAPSLASAANWLRNAQLPDGSWGSDAAQTALAVQALRLAPIVSTIPGQSVISPTAFATINLDNFVADPDHADNQIAWTVTGNSVLNVSVVNRVVTITYPQGADVTEQLTFTATDPDGYSASTTAAFTVAFQVVDYTIARGGSVTGTRSITTTPANFNQIASYSELKTGVPAGVTYTTTGAFLIPPDTVEFDFQITVSPAAATGYHQFSVKYTLRNSASQTLAEQTFNFSIQVTP